jgi:hypothetical protein
MSVILVLRAARPVVRWSSLARQRLMAHPEASHTARFLYAHHHGTMPAQNGKAP